MNDFFETTLDIENKDNVHPLTKVDMSKSIPKKIAKTFGTSVESIFAGDLVKFQYQHMNDNEGNMLILSFPTVDWCPYDILVDNSLINKTKPKIYKVQIKSTEKPTATIAKSTGSRFNNSWDRYYHPYEKGEVDFFAIYWKPKDTWHIIPQKVLDKEVRVKLTQSKLSKYKNNFDIFYR